MSGVYVVACRGRRRLEISHQATVTCRINLGYKISGSFTTSRMQDKERCCRYTRGILMAASVSLPAGSICRTAHSSIGSMLTSPQVAYKHYLRGLSRWPKDALRPEAQFQDALRRRIDRRFLAPSNNPAAKLADEKVELEQANALYSLLENRYSRKVMQDPGARGDGRRANGVAVLAHGVADETCE
jgi:hypothetical protein